MSNTELWSKVERIPAEHTKPITGKSYSGTSPRPHYMIRLATEVFGPCGIGWGFTFEDRIEDGAMIEPGFPAKMSIAKVKVWYIWNGQRGEVEHIGGTEFAGKRKNGALFTDEDAPKKSVTDGLIKALSLIGFAGDIFIGRFDDSKYVEELKAEARDEKARAVNVKPAPRPAQGLRVPSPLEDQSIKWQDWARSVNELIKTATDFDGPERILKENSAALDELAKVSKVAHDTIAERAMQMTMKLRSAA